MDYFFEAFKKYAVFEGRAGRKEMWMFALFNLIVFFIIVFITQDEKSPLIGIYWLVIIIPWVAVGVRRMHDVDKSGWYFIFPVYNLILALFQKKIVR